MTLKQKSYISLSYWALVSIVMITLFIWNAFDKNSNNAIFCMIFSIFDLYHLGASLDKFEALPK